MEENMEVSAEENIIDQRVFKEKLRVQQVSHPTKLVGSAHPTKLTASSEPAR